MIVEVLLNVFKSVIEFSLSILPNIPQFPSAITDSTTYIISLVGGAVGLVSYLFTPYLTVFAFTMFLVILNFDNVYKLSLWVLHKIRG